MNDQGLQIMYDRLLKAAIKLRSSQKKYYEFRTKEDLEDSKRYGRELDRILIDDIKIRNSKQEALF
jgi:hypothetical protein